MSVVANFFKVICYGVMQCQHAAWFSTSMAHDWSSVCGGVMIYSSDFNSQHPHGSSQLSVTPVPGDLTSSSGLWGTKHAGKILRNVKIDRKKSLNTCIRNKGF